MFKMFFSGIFDILSFDFFSTYVTRISDLCKYLEENIGWIYVHSDFPQQKKTAGLVIV